MKSVKASKRKKGVRVCKRAVVVGKKEWTLTEVRSRTLQARRRESWWDLEYEKKKKERKKGTASLGDAGGSLYELGD